MSAAAPPLLDVRNLQKFFPITKGFMRRVAGHVRAVDDVSFTIQEIGRASCRERV